MIYTLFYKILHMSVIASLVILIVLIARMLLKRAPKIFSYALWAVVLFRLLCPISFNLPISNASLVSAPFIKYLKLSAFENANPSLNSFVAPLFEIMAYIPRLSTQTPTPMQGNPWYYSDNWYYLNGYGLKEGAVATSVARGTPFK